jgi:ribosomal-protein-alanine N-acetyltransferase
MNNMIVLDESYIEEILYIQSLRFDIKKFCLITKKSFLELIAKKQIFGYVEDGNLLGYVAVKIYKNSLRVYALATLPKQKGVGDKLIRFIVDYAEVDYERIFLEVSVENFKAVNLYFKHGFKIEKVLESFYKDGVSAYRMSKVL